jgi:nucleoid DNA-binding protein
MIPKKPKLLYKQLAEESDLNEVLVDNLITFYYKEVRKQLSSLNHPSVNIEGLGKFYVKSKTVDSQILKYQRQLAKTDGYSITSYHNKIWLESKLVELEKMKTLLQQKKEDRKNFIKDKYGKHDNQNMEE